VDKEFTRSSTQNLLHDFFNSKASKILEENSLLISRWSRFCRSTSEIVKYKQIFSGHQSRLKAEYNDSIERYERLHEIKLAAENGSRGEEERISQEKADEERKGLGKKERGEAKKNSKLGEDHVADPEAPKEENERFEGRKN
jgi:hypothetical protein